MGHKTVQGLVAAAAGAALMAAVANAQQPGSFTPEVHPQAADVEVHQERRDGSKSCVTSSGLDRSLCPDQATCAQNCFVEGVNYTSSGVETSGNSLTLRQFFRGADGVTNSVSPRVYLLGSDGNYVMLKLLGQELSFDVDVSTLPCGENAALYLSEMEATGWRGPYNTGGAEYGAGYCDAQCPVQNWNNGTVNTGRAGSCCNEMDILESNSRAEAFTPHPCIGDSCDKAGCGFNSYARGYRNYWAPGGTLDTSRPFTMITRFHTDDGTASGRLARIERVYVQDGRRLPSAVPGGDVISADACSSGDPYGGLRVMGEALGRGMVLAMSIWNDASGFMNWLDAGSNGPCSETEGNPDNILANHPNTHVVLSNIRWGDIGSTVDAGDAGDGTPSSTATATASSTSSGPAQPTQTHWGQCGGIGWSGPTLCEPPYTCQYQNDWYSQCL
ncbi:hypothetical protein VTH06DRAFT_3213 [Thermothelomyces fergusii]